MPATLLITEESVFLPKWGCSLTVLFTPDGSYCVLRQLCQIVGVEDVRQQYEQLLRREATREYVTKFPVQTPRRGKQVTYCIHLDVLAWWLAGLNERLIRPEFASQLVRFRLKIHTRPSRTRGAGDHGAPDVVLRLPHAPRSGRKRLLFRCLCPSGGRTPGAGNIARLVHGMRTMDWPRRVPSYQLTRRLS